MVDSELIKRKLERLSEDISHLDRSAQYTLEEFLSEPERYGSAERFLQTAIEATIDIGSHIVSHEKLGTIHAYRDLSRLFFEHALISEELSELWLSMIGFRNILVHEYGKIDREKVYQTLQNNLQDLKALKVVFLQYL